MQRPEELRLPGDKTEPAFDAFDDEREQDALSHYGHHAVPSGYGRQTGRWVSAFGVVTAIVLGAAFFTVSNIRAREKI